MPPTTETKITETPATIVTPGVERTTETTSTDTKTEVVPQVPDQKADGSVVNEDAPTHNGTQFR